jgi:hypothetical protein
MKVNESRAPWFEISIGPILLQLGRYIELRETQYRGCIRLGLLRHARSPLGAVYTGSLQEGEEEEVKEFISRIRYYDGDD